MDFSPLANPSMLRGSNFLKKMRWNYPLGALCASILLVKITFCFTCCKKLKEKQDKRQRQIFQISNLSVPKCFWWSFLNMVHISDKYSKPFWSIRSVRVKKIFPLSPPLSKDEELRDIEHSMIIRNLVLGFNSVTFLYLIYCDSLLQNATDNYYKMRQLFYYKMWQEFTKKWDRFFITKCDSYYKTRRLLQTAAAHTFALLSMKVRKTLLLLKEEKMIPAT